MAVKSSKESIFASLWASRTSFRALTYSRILPWRSSMASEASLDFSYHSLYADMTSFISSEYSEMSRLPFFTL